MLDGALCCAAGPVCARRWGRWPAVTSAYVSGPVGSLGECRSGLLLPGPSPRLLLPARARPAAAVKAIRSDEEDVALQAVEFWSTLCDYELDLAEESDPSEVRDAALKL